jgi:hypothetical protein
MSTFESAYEFAGIAAQEILGQLCLADSETSNAFRLIRECCMAAILGTIIRQRCDFLAQKQANAAYAGQLGEKT